MTKLLGEANERTKLFILMMTNCGMYQSDIAALRQSEVDWKAGTITRKRSKTKGHENVPTVRYRLWRTTFALLKKFRSGDGNLALLNSNGNPLVVRALTADGKPICNDSIKNAYERLKSKTGIRKPLKLFRKTSATLIRSNMKYSGIADLFLGLSPRGIADRHYAQAPQAILDEAVAWLGKQYGVK